MKNAVKRAAIRAAGFYLGTMLNPAVFSKELSSL